MRKLSYKANEKTKLSFYVVKGVFTNLSYKELQDKYIIHTGAGTFQKLMENWNEIVPVINKIGEHTVYLVDEHTKSIILK